MSPVYCLLVSVVLPRDAMLAAADRHLAGLCEYSVPQGGMFLWMRVPGLSSTWDMIMKVSRAASREDFTIKEKAPTSSSIRAFSVITKLRVDLRLKLYCPPANFCIVLVLAKLQQCSITQNKVCFAARE